MRIICYLTALCGGNIHEKGVDNVSHLSIYDGINSFISKFVKIIILLSRMQYDFYDRKVKPTHYSIKSRPKIQPMAIF